MRILITGSRNWDLYESISGRIAEAIKAYGKEHPELQGKRLISDWVYIVHGNCPKGADALADHFARQVLRLPDENIQKYDADWSQFGRSAGYKRNARMVRSMPDMCLAFIRDNSPGSTGCRNLAKQAGIPTETFRYEDELENYGF